MSVPCRSAPFNPVPCRSVTVCPVPYSSVGPGRGAQAVKRMKQSWMHECPIPFCTVPCRSAPVRTVAYRSVPFRTVQYRSSSFRTVPYRSVPFRTVPSRSGGRGRCGKAVKGMKRPWIHDRAPPLFTIHGKYLTVVMC